MKKSPRRQRLVPFHTVPLKKEFRVEKTTFLRISAREALDSDGRFRRFRDADLVQPC